MRKHGKKKEFVKIVNENTIVDDRNFDNNQKENEEEVTVQNSYDKSEECNTIVILDVEIVNLNDQQKSENNKIMIENDTVEENNVEDPRIKNSEECEQIESVHVENVKIVDVEDDIIENRLCDKNTEASDDNSELAENDVKSNSIHEKIAGSFPCKICDVAAKSRKELASHKILIHNWCNKCVSTFDSQDKLKKHCSTNHRKSNK